MFRSYDRQSGGRVELLSHDLVLLVHPMAVRELEVVRPVVLDVSRAAETSPSVVELFRVQVVKRSVDLSTLMNVLL